MGMILRIASSRIVGQGDIVGRSGYFSLNLSANSVMRGRLDARRTLKSLVADLRVINKTISDIPDDKFRVSFGLYLSGYDYEEIVRIMNLPLHEVEYSIRFVKEKLSSGR